MNSAHVFLTFVALLLAQLAVPFDLQFVQGRNFVSPVMLVFGGLAIGQLIYLLFFRGRERASLISHPALLSLILAPLFLTFGHWPEAAPVAAVLIFIIFGVAVSRIYGVQSLGPTVRASAAAGVAAAVAFPLTASMDTAWLKTAVLVVFGASALFEKTRPRLWFAVAAAVLVLMFLQAPLYPGVLLGADAKTKFKYEGPTYFAPLLRMDLYRDTLRDYLAIVTNGIHYAIKSEHDGDKQLPTELHGSEGSALVIGAAGGRRVTMLLNSGYQEVTAVDLNPNVFRAMNDLDGDNSVYRDSRVIPVVAEGRHFLHQNGKKFDLIFIDKVKLGEPVGSISPHFEDFLYTQEALEQMWSRLSPRGVIFFRENLIGRQFALTQGILIEELERAARCSQKMKAAHVLTFGGWTKDRLPRTNNPFSSRAVMLISKSPVSLQSLKDGELSLRPQNQGEDCANVVSDERPFHSNQAAHRPMYAWALLISVLPALLLVWRWGRIKPAAIDALAFTAGLLYIIWLVGATGLLFLFIDNPALISPVTLFTSFAAGVLCFHLPVSDRRVLRAVAGLAIVAAPLVFLLVENKGYFLAQTGWSAPLLVLLLFAPGFVLVETPYMTVLRRNPNTIRVLIFENWGCLVAIPLCYLVKAQLGFLQIALAALAFSALLCMLLVRDHRG